jgi:hypothetical protein
LEKREKKAKTDIQLHIHIHLQKSHQQKGTRFDMSGMIPALLRKAKATGRLASLLGATSHRDGRGWTDSLPLLSFSMQFDVAPRHHFGTETTKGANRSKEDNILASAGRIFSENLETSTASVVEESQFEASSIPAEIKEEHKQRVAALQRRRKKFPLEQHDVSP